MVNQLVATRNNGGMSLGVLFDPTPHTCKTAQYAAGVESLDDSWQGIAVLGKIDIKGKQQTGPPAIPRPICVSKGAFYRSVNETRQYVARQLGEAPAGNEMLTQTHGIFSLDPLVMLPPD